MEINIKEWNETEGRIRYYKESIFRHGRLKGKKCRHSVFVKDIEKVMPLKYDTFQKQMYTKGKWRAV